MRVNRSMNGSVRGRRIVVVVSVIDLLSRCDDTVRSENENCARRFDDFFFEYRARLMGHDNVRSSPDLCCRIFFF